MSSRQVFYKISLNLNLSDIFPISLGLRILVEEDCRDGVSLSLHDTERFLPNHERCQDSWPPEEKNSIWGQRWGLIAQNFCVIKFYWSIKDIEKASDIDIRRGQKEYPLASVSNGTIYLLISYYNKSKECLKFVKILSDPLPQFTF